MAGDSPAARLRENATEVASALVTGIWLAALFTGQDWWLAALILGYVVVVPVVSLLFGDDDESSEERWWDDLWNSTVVVGSESDGSATPDEPTETPLETLRRRYAAGELTEAQFERKLERLLETETIEDAEESVGRRRLRERTE